MATMDPIPQARGVKKAGQLMTPPRAPRSELPGPLADHLRAALATAIGMWPLTGVVLLMIGLIFMASRAGSP